MTRKTPLALAALLALVGLVALILACASTSPVTTWYYSAWYSETMTASEGGFEEARSACLRQLGISDPAAVKPGSETENGFIQCMNANRWCTNAYKCSRPGA